MSENLFKKIDEISKKEVENYRIPDTDTDRKVLMQYAESGNPDDKYLLWMTRKNGTWLFVESCVFLKGSPQYEYWTYYKDLPNENPYVYLIHIEGMTGGEVFGEIAELPAYEKHAAYVEENAVRGQMTLRYDNNTIVQNVSDEAKNYVEGLGMLREISNLRPYPEDAGKLSETLRKERKKLKG